MNQNAEVALALLGGVGLGISIGSIGAAIPAQAHPAPQHDHMRKITATGTTGTSQPVGVTTQWTFTQDQFKVWNERTQGVICSENCVDKGAVAGHIAQGQGWMTATLNAQATWAWGFGPTSDAATMGIHEEVWNGNTGPAGQAADTFWCSPVGAWQSLDFCQVVAWS